MYYREKKVAISVNPTHILPIGVFVWDLDAVINDADARNTAFLNLIKSKFIQDDLKNEEDAATENQKEIGMAIQKM